MIRLLVFIIIAGACTADASSGIAASEVVCPTDSTLTYESFGSAFFADHCLSCHTSKQSPVLSTQSAIQLNRSAIIGVAVTSTRMPADGDLAVEERRLLGEWLACGAP